MPPKPWETRRRNNQDISQIIQSNPTPKEEVPKLPTDNNINANSTTSTVNTEGATNPDSMNNGSYGPAGNYGGMGSSYGGMGGYGSSYGGYGSSYGSSYGGYGGYGGGYGSSYGGYGMGMGSMYGMNGYGRQDQSQFLMEAARNLQYFGYVINSLCQIANLISHNSEGFSLIYKAFKNTMNRMKNWAQSGSIKMLNSIKNFFLKIFNFLMENIFFMRQKQLRSKYKALKLVTYLSVMVLAVTCYPLIRKAIKNL